MRSNARRGSVMVLVVAVLALLFIIGVTVLTVMRFDRQSVIMAAQAAEIRAVHDKMTDSVLQQLRQDVVGSDGIPYNGI